MRPVRKHESITSYFDEGELLVRREIKTNSLKSPNSKSNPNKK